MVKVKICGVTNVADALECARLGADAVGVITEVPVDSPRKMSAGEVRRIFEALPTRVECFTVVMPKSLDAAIRLYEATNPDVVQLHGKEPVSLVEALKSKLPCKVAKAIHVRDGSAIEEALEYSRHCDYLLLDTPSKMGGGSGVTHDWEVSKKIVEEAGIPVILSGGLNPLNVGGAIKMVKPYYVDASSGVESKPGVKDTEKVRKFIENAKSRH